MMSQELGSDDLVPKTHTTMKTFLKEVWNQLNKRIRRVGAIKGDRH